MPLHDQHNVTSKAGFFVLLASFLALAFSLATTRDRLTQELKPGAQPVASDSSLLEQ